MILSLQVVMADGHVEALRGANLMTCNVQLTASKLLAGIYIRTVLTMFAVFEFNGPTCCSVAAAVNS